MANSKGIRWTDGMLDRVKRDCLTRMKDQGSDCEYDVEKFCDCLTNKVALHSPTFLLDVTPRLGRGRLQKNAASKRLHSIEPGSGIVEPMHAYRPA